MCPPGAGHVCVALAGKRNYATGEFHFARTSRMLLSRICTIMCLRGVDARIRRADKYLFITATQHQRKIKIEFNVLVARNAKVLATKLDGRMYAFVGQPPPNPQSSHRRLRLDGWRVRSERNGTERFGIIMCLFGRHLILICFRLARKRTPLER